MIPGLSKSRSPQGLRSFMKTYQATTSAGYLRNVGTEILRFNLGRAIVEGDPFAAARYTRSLVRHMKATGLLVNDERHSTGTGQFTEEDK